MAGLKDIAERAGLSINTVSRALRGSGYVSAGNREKILRIAQELGYKANRAARSLRFRKSFEISVIGFIGENALSFDDLHMQKILGAQKFLRNHGYEINLDLLKTSEHTNVSGVKKNLENIIARNPEGAIILSGWTLGKSIYKTLQAAGIPCILISYSEDADFDCVYIDRCQGVYDAVCYMIKKGRKKIAFAGPDNCRNRLAGYRQAITDYGLQENILTVNNYFNKNMDEISLIGQSLAGRISEMDERPDAIQAYSDYFAAGMIAGFQEKGVKIPEDIAICGFDNRELACFTRPGLTTVEQPNYKTGELAAEKLLEKIKHGTDFSGAKVKVPMSLIIRKSV